MSLKISAYRILVGIPKGERPLGRIRGRWDDNIEIDLREIGWGGWDSSGSVQRSVVGYCKNGNEISGSIKFLEFLIAE
jgi:hypothetical protein